MVAVRFKRRAELGQQLVATVRAILIRLHRRPFDHPAQLAFIECARPDLFRPALQHPIRVGHEPAIQGIVRIAPIERSAEKGRHPIPPSLCLCPRRGWVVAAISARCQHGFRDDDVKFQPASMDMCTYHDERPGGDRDPGEYAFQKHVDRVRDNRAGSAALVEFQQVEFVWREAERHSRKAILKGLLGNRCQCGGRRSDQQFRRGRAHKKTFTAEFQRSQFCKKVSRKAHCIRVVQSRLVPLHHHFGATRSLTAMIAASCASMRCRAEMIAMAVASSRAANPRPPLSTAAQRVRIP